MQEKLYNALYVYGVIKTEESSWPCTGLEGNQVLIISGGKLKALAHPCEAKLYAPADLENIKKMIIEHNNVLGTAMESFGSVLPFAFNNIIREKEGKSAEENLKDWLRKEEKSFEQLLEKIKGRKEYGIKFFYNRKEWIKEIRAQSGTISEKGSGISYLLKGKQEFEIKDKLIKRLNEKRQELFNAANSKVNEIKIAQPKVKLIEDKKDLLVAVSVLANNQEFDELKQFLQNNISQEDYQCAGPFPPYSFVGDAGND